ncbi:MAG: discoidin domain-containing protein [Armatimonadia bacterium]
MPRSLVVLAVLLLVVSLTYAAPVKNAEFVDRAAANANWPAEWTAAKPDLAFYAAVNDDGAKDSNSLHYTMPAPAVQTAGVVTQTVALVKNTDYVFSAALKSDGLVKPAIRLMGPAGQLAVLASDGSKVWKTFTARFNSGAAETATIEIYGDGARLVHEPISAGFSAVDAVQVYLPNEVPAGVAVAAAFTPPGPNIALGKKYTLQPAPNYGLSADAGDATQLTDGQYTVGYFWAQKTTVGWQNTNPAIITIDLGKIEPIAGLSFDTAAGVAGVSWPSSILVLVSDDGKTWGSAGELISMSTKQGAPASQPYSTYRFATGDMKTHGRWVKLFVDNSPYTFVDEVEVYQGSPDFLQIAYADIVSDPMAIFEAKRVHAGVLWRLRTDLATARNAIAAAEKLPADQKQALLERASRIEQQIGTIPEKYDANFKTILPLNEMHANIYALYAPIHRSNGMTFLNAWQNNRWDMLQPTQGPTTNPSVAPALSVKLMQREYRATTFNLTNANVMPADLTVEVKGLPGGSNPSYLSVRDIPWTDTRERIPIAAALPEAAKQGNLYRINVPSGMVRQIWLEFHPLDVKPGTYRGQVVVTGSKSFGQITMPLTLVVSTVSFPAMPSIHVGGWDYTQGKGQYEAKEAIIPQLIQTLTANYVDTPWASSAVQPAGMTFDPEGKLAKQPTFAGWDEWTAKWPGARQYAVFLSVPDSFAGEKMGTPRFKQMVGDWITAWVEHMATQNLKPEQLVLLLFDEPHGPGGGTDIIREWARAINAVQPGVTLFEDPTYSDPTVIENGFWEDVDVLCPNLPMWLAAPQSFRDFYLAQQKAGRELWFYSCSGPSKLLDPITYHRSQFWHAVAYNAKGSFYWAFGDEAGASSWNAYLQKRAQYSPLYLDDTSVTDAKHMAAIREGAQDFEYFVMLRSRVAELEKKGVKNPLVEQAKKLLVDGPQRVISGVTDKNLAWPEEKDRGTMDEVRLQVLDMLEKLAKL